ncbi:MAG: hypothetical protein WCE54_22600 [Ignavibacteriaceae bacterium]
MKLQEERAHGVTSGFHYLKGNIINREEHPDSFFANVYMWRLSDGKKHKHFHQFIIPLKLAIQMLQ